MLMTDICRRLPLLHLGNPPEGGGGTPSYKPYRYVPPQRVWFLRRFGPKRLYCLFWSGIVHGFRGNYGSVLTYLSFPIANE